VVKTGSDALYSILRVSQEEAVLVLINLTGESVFDYHLELDESSLEEGNYLLATIIGEGPYSPLAANSEGGFSDYAPIPVVPPYGTIVVQLQPLSDNP
jgi:hypothetical protein